MAYPCLCITQRHSQNCTVSSLLLPEEDGERIYPFIKLKKALYSIPLNSLLAFKEGAERRLERKAWILIGSSFVQENLLMPTI